MRSSPIGRSLVRRLPSRHARLGALAAALGLLLVPVAQASAAPTVSSVQGFYSDPANPSDYVIFDVRSTGADEVWITWPGHGYACATSSKHSHCFVPGIRLASTRDVAFGFNGCGKYKRVRSNRRFPPFYRKCVGPVTSYAVWVKACVHHQPCSRAQHFTGSFTNP